MSIARSRSRFRIDFHWLGGNRVNVEQPVAGFLQAVGDGALATPVSHLRMNALRRVSTSPRVAA